MASDQDDMPASDAERAGETIMDTTTEAGRQEIAEATRKLRPQAAAIIREWGQNDVIYAEFRTSHALRRLGFVEPFGGGMSCLTEAGKVARRVLRVGLGAQDAV